VEEEVEEVVVRQLLIPYLNLVVVEEVEEVEEVEVLPLKNQLIQVYYQMV
jgi:hypothetical protein